MSCPRSANFTPKPLSSFSFTSATPSSFLSAKRQRCGMHVYQTSPPRAISPAPVPSAASRKPPAKIVTLSATPLPVLSSNRRMRSSNFSNFSANTFGSENCRRM